MAYAFEIGDDLPDPPTRAGVEADLADWKARLDGLMADVCRWAGEFPDVLCERGSVAKIERKMQMVGLTAPVELPALLLRRLVTQSVRPLPVEQRTAYMVQEALPGRILRHEATLSITPDARWVLGTRGQVWIRSDKIFDTVADIGTPEQPDWRLIRRADPEHLIPFTRDVLHELLGRLQ
jgi:hypothetical protein